MGVEILSTGGTAKKLRAAGVDVVDVSTYTGSPEMLMDASRVFTPKSMAVSLP